MKKSSRIASGVVQIPTGIGNLYMIAGRKTWFLVDAGTAGHTEHILDEAEKHFHDRPPEAILLTHGHFDHSGCAAELSDHWDVPVYAHTLELPYLTGKSKYPEPDPTVGGFMGFMIRFLPNKTYDLGKRVSRFPKNPLPGWEMVETPGHSPGHVSFYRHEDGVLIAGDAVTTVKQRSMRSMLTQEQHVWLPPEYYTCDWHQARASVERLAALRPRVIAAGHGQPMRGSIALQQLVELAASFPAPHGGRYTEEPAVTDKRGVRKLPPKPFDPVATAFYGTSAVVGMAGVLGIVAGKRAA